MGNDPWEHASDDHLLWTAFEDRFQFRLNFQRGNGSAIAEPQGSVTVDLTPIFEASDRAEFEVGARQVDQQVLESFQHVFDNTTQLVVLDWQHPTYRFRPHAITEATGWPLWPVTPFPDGDYHVFLTEDMNQGTFGHPWERTLCVWGDDLVRDLVPRLQLPVKRARR